MPAADAIRESSLCFDLDESVIISDHVEPVCATVVDAIGEFANSTELSVECTVCIRSWYLSAGVAEAIAYKLNVATFAEPIDTIAITIRSCFVRFRLMCP